MKRFLIALLVTPLVACTADVPGNYEFDDPPAKFVVSPNSPVSQVWVSAQMKSFKLDWDSKRSAFVLLETGQTLVDLVAGAVGQQLGEQVRL